MAECIIRIADVPADAGNDAGFRMEVSYGEAFDESSHAHKFSKILLYAADQLAERRGDIEAVE